MKRLDDLAAQLERVLILACVAGMTVLVGADVVQRTFSRPVGKTEQILAWLGVPVGEHEGDLVFGACALVFCIVAAHASRHVTAERSKAPPPRVVGSVVLGALAFGLLSGLVWGILGAFPSSVPGAQKFALGLMLWSGMLGASMATRERRHIVLDAVTKKLDEQMRRPFALVSGLVTGAFCGTIAYLGLVQVQGEIDEWARTPGTHLYESLPIPTWLATLSIPVCFFLMAARFTGYGIRDFVKGPPPPTESEGVDLEALAKLEIEG